MAVEISELAEQACVACGYVVPLVIGGDGVEAAAAVVGDEDVLCDRQLEAERP